MKTNPRAAFGLLAALALTTSSASAQMNYQGRLTDANGDGLAGAQATITFSIWDQEGAGAGAKLWGDFQTNADLIDGRFNVILGPTDSMNRNIDQAFAGGARFLEIKVGTDLPLPRQQVLAAPEAMAATHATNLHDGDNALATAAEGFFRVPTLAAFGSALTPTSTQANTINILAGDNDSGLTNGITFWENTAFGMSLGYDGSGAGATNALRFYSNASAPLFSIENGGNVDIAGSADIAGDVDVSGNITAGTITGTLTTPSLQLPDNLSVGTSTTSHKVVIETNSGSDDALRLVGSETNGSGARLNFGDSNFVYLDEPFDDGFRIQASEVGIGGDPVNGGDKLQVFGDADISGVLTLGDTVDINMEGAFDAVDINCTRDSLADTYPLEFTAITPGFTHVWSFFIDSSDPGDADLVLQYNGSNSAVCEPNANGWRAQSDRQLKKDIVPLQNCLDTVMSLNPSQYRFKAALNERTHIGFIAQEVAEVLPSQVKDLNGILTLNYSDFGVLSVGAVKELKAELDAEKSKNAALEARLEAIEARLAELD